MSRRRRTRLPFADSGTPALLHSPFQALVTLKNKKKKSAALPTLIGKHLHEPQKRQHDKTEDITLFRQAMLNVKPLKPNNKANITCSLPAPILRNTAHTKEQAPQGLSSLISDDPLLAAYQDVTPLQNNNKVYLPPQKPSYLFHSLLSKSGSCSTFSPNLPDLLSSDPALLFQHVLRDVQPLKPSNRVEHSPPPPPPYPLQREADEKAALGESLHQSLNFEDQLIIDEESAFLRTGLPRRILNDLRRKRWILQGEIDLHGLTRDQAREALNRFIYFSLQNGRRHIRVIHGKGHGSPGRIPILKNLARHWLAQREEILAFCQAGPHDGGEGALLVLLRTPKSLPGK